MPLLPILSVVFVGVVGGDNSDRIEQQVQVLLGELDVKTLPMRVTAVRKIARHAPGSREAIAGLHMDGLIGGELVGDRAHRVLRMVIYDAEGGLDSLFEIPFSGHRLSRDELSMLQTSVEDVGELVAKGKAREAKHQDAGVAIAPRKAQPHREPSHEAPAEAPHEAPAPQVAAATEEPTPAPAAADLDSDAVTADELLAATSGVTSDEVTLRMPVQESSLRIAAAVGVGVGGRTFTPGPATVPGYSSSAVGVVHLDAGVEPTSRTRLAVVAERTLTMSTPLATGAAATTISRWEAVSGYAVAHDRLEVTLQGGIGRRSFSIESADPTRTPNSSYNYLIAGVAAGTRLGDHVAIHGGIAFEPVVSGEEPMESSFGGARRWALAVGGALEVRPRTHLVLRAAANYQRFAWSWTMAGNRGAGGAVDHYPSATLSVGAEY